MGIFDFLKNTEKKSDAAAKEDTHNEDSTHPFLMKVEDTFSIAGRGTVVTGKIASGLIRLNEEIFIYGGNQRKRAKVSAIEISNTLVDEARTWDEVGLFLGKLPKEEVKRGYIVTTDSNFSLENYKSALETDTGETLVQRLVKEAQERMESAGLKMYIWETSGDERVKPSCKKMDGKLCLWSDPTVYSRNKGKDWMPRPAGAPLTHPGEEDGCRCTALAYEPELLGDI